MHSENLHTSIRSLPILPVLKTPHYSSPEVSLTFNWVVDILNRKICSKIGNSIFSPFFQEHSRGNNRSRKEKWNFEGKNSNLRYILLWNFPMRFFFISVMCIYAIKMNELKCSEMFCVIDVYMCVVCVFKHAHCCCVEMIHMCKWPRH